MHSNFIARYLPMQVFHKKKRKVSLKEEIIRLNFHWWGKGLNSKILCGPRTTSVACCRCNLEMRGIVVTWQCWSESGLVSPVVRPSPQGQSPSPSPSGQSSTESIRCESESIEPESESKYESIGPDSESSGLESESESLSPDSAWTPGLAFLRVCVSQTLYFFSGRTSLNLNLPLRVHLDAHVFTME